MKRPLEIQLCQCRAARAALGWSAADLAAKANVARSTIADFERGAREPIRNNLCAIIKTFAEAGVLLVTTERGEIGVTWGDE